MKGCKCKYAILFYSILLFLQGCEMNRSVDFYPGEQKTFVDNVAFSVNWQYGIPLYYFKYKPMETSFLINLETDSIIEDVVLESYTIQIAELDITIVNTEQSKIDMMDTLFEQNSIATKRYWGGERIRVENLLADKIENEEQLERFKNIKYVDLIIGISYTIDGVERSSRLNWKFNPAVRKSNALLDKLMSV